MHPDAAAEPGECFRFADTLWFGLLPVVLGAPDLKEKSRAYNGLYLREEAQTGRLARNTGSFAHILEVSSFRTPRRAVLDVWTSASTDLRATSFGTSWTPRGPTPPNVPLRPSGA